MNAAINPQAIIDRSMGFLRLNTPTYEEVEHDQGATSQAAVVVVVASIAAAIGGLDDGANGFIGALVVGILSWFITSAVVYFVGTRLTASTQTEADLGQILRTLGFAQVAGVINVIAFIPVVGVLAALAAFVWGIVMTFKAIQQSLEMSPARALVTAVIAWLAAAIIAGIIFSIMGIDLG